MSGPPSVRPASPANCGRETSPGRTAYFHPYLYHTCLPLTLFPECTTMTPLGLILGGPSIPNLSISAQKSTKINIFLDDIETCQTIDHQAIRFPWAASARQRMDSRLANPQRSPALMVQSWRAWGRNGFGFTLDIIRIGPLVDEWGCCSAQAPVLQSRPSC